jgi:starch phosphorylase
MVKRSIARLAAQFSTNRMVRDYATEFYMPSAAAFQKLSGGGLERARGALEWRDRVRSQWGQVRVVAVSDTAAVSNLVGETFELTAHVELGSLSPNDVRVQAVVGKVGPNRELVNRRVEDLEFRQTLEGGRHEFTGRLTADLPGHQGYTVRVIPSHEDISTPSELSLVAWE